MTLGMWEKFLYLICEGLVPAPHIATQKASVGIYAVVTTIHVCELFGTVIPISSFNFCYSSFSLSSGQLKALCHGKW